MSSPRPRGNYSINDHFNQLSGIDVRDLRGALSNMWCAGFVLTQETSQLVRHGPN